MIPSLNLFRQALSDQNSGQYLDAIQNYREFLNLVPYQIDAMNNMAVCLIELDRSKEAADILLEALQKGSRDPEILNNLGNALQQLSQLEKAVGFFESALSVRPDSTVILLNFSKGLLRIGDYNRALEYLKKAKDLDPNNSSIAFIEAMALPIIYESEKEISIVRNRVMERLDALNGKASQIADPASAVGQTNFYLAYQGYNDKDIQSKIAETYLKLSPQLKYVSPHCLEQFRNKAARIKLGFVSSHFGNHTIGKLFQGLLAGLSQEKFEIFVFYVGFASISGDHKLEALSDKVDHLIGLPKNFWDARKAISDRRLDILYYPDIGMEPLTYFLAFARLARTQCASWGHPVTTGIPTVDYFVSWRIHEPQDYLSHYSEEVKLLGGFCTNYARPGAPRLAIKREQFGWHPSDHLYVCLQSLFKFHPSFDAILWQILKADDRAIIILLEGRQRNWGRLLRKRFLRIDPTMLERIQFLPRLNNNDYLGIISLSDVVLDTPVFSGGNSSFEALALGKVIVTLAGKYMRGLFTAGLYYQMGLHDLITSTASSYIKLALAVATNPKARAKYETRIKERNHLIFDNDDTIKSHERFFEFVYHRH
ncbi:MAG: tetratricopeptide repeat protein [Pseudomonadota bacterium]|nr:tetratricopeptide repeat protein [Pseudomonadota bacterium]